MALEGHLSGLETKHQRLEQELEAIRSHPSADPLELKRLKQEKLKVKDELNRLLNQRAGT